MSAPQSVAANAVRQIIERLCGGSVEQLLVGMVANDVVDEQELQRLAQRIARNKKPEGECDGTPLEGNAFGSIPVDI